MAEIFLNVPKPLTKWDRTPKLLTKRDRTPKPLIKWNRWKLKRLYDANPLTYFVAGLTTIFYFGTPAGYGVGALLLIAALWIWMLRSVRRAFMNRIE
jgi:hypothetical protein